MNVFSSFEHRSSLAAAILSLPLGVALFFLVRLMETLGPGAMVVNVLLEEAIKIILFAGFTVSARAKSWSKILNTREDDRDGRRSTLLLVPVLCIVTFAITENIVYFISFPTSSIYRRLLYSYPIHINTALFYALAFLSGGALRTALYFVIGVAYHLGLNYLSVNLQVFLVYMVGVGNLVILFLLYWRVRMKICKGVLGHAGIQDE